VGSPFTKVIVWTLDERIARVGTLRAVIPAGVASAVGSMPGTDIREAVRFVLGELPDLPHLPELPARGVGADMTGRAAALLVDLHAEVTTSGWRFADRPGRDERRAVSLLAEDLDALEEHAGEYDGPLKVQVAGPWTVAATVELKYGDKVLADPGACRDVAASLAEGVARHVAEVRRRVPRAQVIVQLDEPALPGVLAGTVPTASGFGRLPAVEQSVAERALGDVVRGAGVALVVHSCALDVPLPVLRKAGVAGVSLDLSLLGPHQEEALGELVEDGAVVFAGVVPALDTPLSGVRASVAPVTALWRRLGFAPAQLASSVVVTPACGLAGASPSYVRAALARCREAARVLVEDPEG
jgi:methionine synthase II (cobalamin-independent)